MMTLLPMLIDFRSKVVNICALVNRTVSVGDYYDNEFKLHIVKPENPIPLRKSWFIANNYLFLPAKYLSY